MNDDEYFLAGIGQILVEDPQVTKRAPYEVEVTLVQSGKAQFVGVYDASSEVSRKIAERYGVAAFSSAAGCPGRCS